MLQRRHRILAIPLSLAERLVEFNAVQIDRGYRVMQAQNSQGKVRIKEKIGLEIAVANPE